MQVTFPHRHLVRDVRFYPIGMSLEPQRSINGAETIVPTMRARWMATAEFLLHDEAGTLEWEAFLAQMEGRIGTTLVPSWTRYRPKDRDGHSLAFCDTANLAHAQTWEHFGFENTDLDRVVVAANAPLRAMQLDISLNNSTGIRPGHKFSIGDRLYWCQAHWQPDANTHRIMFTPGLRQNVTAGTRIEIEKPVCRMRMVSEEEGVFGHGIDLLPTVTCNFEEAI